jgi:hypothetical protein
MHWPGVDEQTTSIPTRLASLCVQSPTGAEADVSHAVKPRSDGRTAGGRFGLGNTFAHGNPVNRRMAEMRAAMLDAVTPEAVADATRKLAEMAATGDLQAIRLLFDYVVGKPVPGVTSLDPGPDPNTFLAVIVRALEPFTEARRALTEVIRLWAETGVPPLDPVDDALGGPATPGGESSQASPSGAFARV